MVRSFRIVAAALPLLWAQAAHAQHRYQAEASQLTGVTISSAVSGFSGSGYVTGFDSSAGTDRVRWQVDVPNGLYEMWVGYRSPFGEKGYNFQVDGSAGSGMFNQSSSFSTDRAGLFNLTAATNTFQISQGWGYYDIDYVEFRPFVPPAPDPISARLVDPLADSRTRVLMSYLAEQYGKKTIAGQQHNGSQNLPFPGQSYLDRSGGLTPALRSSDFIEYSPSRGAFGSQPRNETEQSIAWAQQTGGIVSMLWHWNAPANLVNQPGQEWWRGFYTTATTFNLPGALANPAGQDYQLLLRDIDAIAVELKKFQAAGVPVLWRPLHEAQGGWFWWGAHGPETFKSLWNLTYDRLTNTHGLHNLIWEFTSSAALGNHLEWYPGDDVVDMVGLDIYTEAGATMSGEWHDVLQHYDGRKMIALSETGT
ncbi:MAG TPA: glycosyl hydrolase, partial [Lacipirellulaceae bacterium]|nr:glycosyl hydrolase [Lacipirellulaceae bacterium]